MTSQYHPGVDIHELLNQRYDHWRFPNSIDEVVNFAVHFNGHIQPIVHDYPWSLPIISIALYWVFIYFCPKFMQNRQKFELKFVGRVWNLFLFIISLGMFLGMVGPTFSFLFQKGFYQLVCLPEGELYYGIPFFCIWVFALSKYIELFDTVILILRKKPVSFLHWYHHTTVLAYTWFSMVILSPPGAIFGVVNTFVHTVMYFYYFLHEMGIPPSWGKFVTVIQLLQMLIGIVTSSFWSYYYLSGSKCPVHHPQAYLISTLMLYVSYFILFYTFYRKRYNGKSKPAPAPATPTGGKKGNQKKQQ